MTPDQRQQIIAKSAAGVATTELVPEFGRSASAIKYTIKTYTNRATTVERPRSGRPPILSRHQKRLLYRKVRANPKIEYLELAKVAQVVSLDDTTSKLPSKSTLYQALKGLGLTNFRCKERPLLTRARALKRVKFCRTYRNHN